MVVTNPRVWRWGHERLYGHCLENRPIEVLKTADAKPRRTEKEPPPTVLGDTVEGASAAIAEVEEELGWKQQVLDALLAMPPDAFERLS